MTQYYLKIKTIESHAAGEPLRVIVDGWPEIPGRTILEKRAFAKAHHDAIRRALMWEPRGHADMYGAILTPPVTPDGDLGVLFLHNEGFSTMCGHGVIALVTVVLEIGLLRREGNPAVVRLDTPAGRVTARARLKNGRVDRVAFENVPSFAQELDQDVEVPGLGRVGYHLSFGGAYYAYCDAKDLGVGLDAQDHRAMMDAGMRVKRAVMAARPILHPVEKDLGYLYGTILSGPPQGPGANLRNVCIFADGQVDRSPTGTGVSGRVAIEYARGRLQIGEPFVIESMLGTRFTGRVLRESMVGSYKAVVPEVEGSAEVVGEAEFWMDLRDPARGTFLLR
jgi:trans-L-3-hydroxyproline dehydratase